MIGVYDNSTGEVAKPFVVSDKMGVDDPHDNPSILIDEDGLFGCLLVVGEEKDLGLNIKV